MVKNKKRKNNNINQISNKNSMSKAAGTPDKKPKNTGEIISIIIAIVSLVFSVVSTIYSIKISNHINDFTMKMSQLNYSIDVTPPNVYSYEELLESEHVDVDFGQSENNITFTTSPYQLNLKKDKVSGEYFRIMIAAKYESGFDIYSWSNDEKIDLNTYVFKDGSMIMLSENEKDHISFYYSAGLENLTEREYVTFDIVLQGYNGEFYIFTVLYSTSNYYSLVIDNTNLYTVNLYDQFITENNLTITGSNLINEIRNERSELSSCLNS